MVRARFFILFTIAGFLTGVTAAAGEPEYVRIRNRYTGFSLHVENGPLEATGDVQPGWFSADWEIQQLSDASEFVRLRNRFRAVSVHNEPGLATASAIDPGASSAHWKQKPVPGTTFVRFESRSRPGEYLHTEHGVVESGPIAEGWFSAQWEIVRREAVTTLPTATAPGVDSLAVANSVLYGESAPDICWQKSYPRGAGEPLSTCGPGQEKDGLLCYPRCREGFDGVGPVCWRRCPAGFDEFGVSCVKPAPYGRGGGYTYDPIFNIVTEADARRKCEKKEKVPCERTGLIIYPKCKKGYALVPPNICSPVCPAGFRNDGAFCAKESYGRTAGAAMGCRNGLDQSGALCYPACPSGSSGVGPVCWADTCPPNYPVNCGAACAVSQAACAMAIIDQVQSSADMALNVAALITTAGAATPALKAAQTAGRSMRRTLSGAAREQLKRQAREQLESAMRWKRQHDKVDQAQGWLDNAGNVDQAAEMMVDAYENGQFDFTVLAPSSIADIEPTGVLALVRSFNKPICSR